MQKELTIKDLKLRVQRSIYKDGLLEIFAGIYLTFLGLMVDHTISIAFLPILMYGLKPALEAAKKRLIYPRIGYVKFREDEEVNGKAILWIVITLAVVAVSSPFISILILGKEPGWEFWTRRFLPFYMGGIMAVASITAAIGLRVKRWYAFGFVCIAAGLWVPSLGLESIYTPIGIEYRIFGGVAFITGVIMFIAFLIKYPVDKTLGEESDE
jgi:hypothetical protein